MPKFLFLFPLLAVFSLAAQAQEDPRGDTLAGCEHGKVNTEDPSVVDVGDTEIESDFGYAFAHKAWDGDNLSRRDFSREGEKAFKITHGIFDNVDAAIEGGLARLEDKGEALRKGQGFTDIAVNGRYRFVNDESHALEVAYIGGLTLPTGAQSNGKISISQRYWSFDQKFAAVKDWGLWTANADVGFSVPFGTHVDGERGAAVADLAVGYQVLPWLQPEVEANYAYSMSAEGDSETLALTAGLVMPLTETWCAGTGVQQAVAGRNADRSTRISVVIKKTF